MLDTEGLVDHVARGDRGSDGTLVPSVENGFAIAAYFHLPLEYFLKGEPVISDFRDATLRELCHEVDQLSDGDREIAKHYLGRLLQNRAERETLQQEAFSDG